MREHSEDRCRPEEHHITFHVKPDRLGSRFYLLFAVLPVLAPSQQVREGQWLQGAGPGRSGVPEGLRALRVLPTSDRAQRA